MLKSLKCERQEGKEIEANVGMGRQRRKEMGVRRKRVEGENKFLLTGVFFLFMFSKPPKPSRSSAAHSPEPTSHVDAPTEVLLFTCVLCSVTVYSSVG